MCSHRRRDENQLHAAVVELVALEGCPHQVLHRAELVSGGRGRRRWHLQLRHQARRVPRQELPHFLDAGGDRLGDHLEVPELGAAGSRARSASSTRWRLVNNHQQADTGTKMIHIGRDTRSTIVSKGISAGAGQNTYRGLVKMLPSAHGARNFTQCDSLLMGDKCAAHTFPYVEVKNSVRHRRARGEHLQNQRRPAVLPAVAWHRRGGCGQHDREWLLQIGVQGAADGVRAVEASKLLAVSLEGAVG